MKVFVKKRKRLNLVASTKPERDLLKDFLHKEPYILSFDVEEEKGVETKVTLTIGFRYLAKPQKSLQEELEDSGLKVLF